MVYQVMANRRNEKNDGRAEALFRLCDNAGFFPEDMNLGEKFADRMLADCSQIDLIGEWRRFMEDYIYYRYQPNTIMTELHCLEPWNMYMYPKSDIKPCTAALKGKKVLVIHPFTESIRKQYEENRTKIFSRIFDADDILPEFELKTLKAVQTLKSEKDARFETWFDALAWMEDECRKIDFRCSDNRLWRLWISTCGGDKSNGENRYTSWWCNSDNVRDNRKTLGDRI